LSKNHLTSIVALVFAYKETAAKTKRTIEKSAVKLRRTLEIEGVIFAARSVVVTQATILRTSGACYMYQKGSRTGVRVAKRCALRLRPVSSLCYGTPNCARISAAQCTNSTVRSCGSVHKCSAPCALRLFALLDGNYRDLGLRGAGDEIVGFGNDDNWSVVCLETAHQTRCAPSITLCPNKMMKSSE
jgi:hypothetical protein